MAISEIVLVRHGATDWTESGRHTGRTDLPLTDDGRAAAEALRVPLGKWQFSRVVSSPSQRAVETARYCGLGDRAEVDDSLVEWDYGDYEGIRTIEIRKTRPGWTIWNGGCPNGESADDVGVRADRVIEHVADGDGTVALFGHSHMFRVLIARWLGLPAVDGSLFILDTSSISVLAYERETRVLQRLNA